jgi:hypothetical protein
MKMINIKKNITDNFIWRNPLDSEEAKGNVVYTCSEHGKETYFRIKALEGQRNMKTMCMCGSRSVVNRKRCG